MYFASVLLDIWPIGGSNLRPSNKQNRGKIHSLKGTTRAKFSNFHNLWKPYDNNACIGYRQPKSYKGTPGVLKHYSSFPLASPGGPLKNVVCYREDKAAGTQFLPSPCVLNAYVTILSLRRLSLSSMQDVWHGEFRATK